MSENKLKPALDPDAIFAKSKIYINRALLRKEDNDLDEYQLWASLALELLAKSSLARIHPSLIAAPDHADSLFAAAGKNLSADIKTITAHTLFERLKRLFPKFDETVKKFCNEIALRRNAELHSGETPFKAMILDAWEARYWYATETILEPMSLTLDDWLGATNSELPKEILKHAIEAKRKAVIIRIERAKENFSALKKSEKTKAIDESKSRQSYHYRNLFTLLNDHEWEWECPACNGKAYLAGIRVSEEIVDAYSDENGAWESVETIYSAEQFRCPVCSLFLNGFDELEAAQIDTTYSETDEREMEYEPEYGND